MNQKRRHCGNEESKYFYLHGEICATLACQDKGCSNDGPAYRNSGKLGGPCSLAVQSTFHEQEDHQGNHTNNFLPYRVCSCLFHAAWRLLTMTTTRLFESTLHSWWKTGFYALWVALCMLSCVCHQGVAGLLASMRAFVFQVPHGSNKKKPACISKWHQGSLHSIPNKCHEQQRQPVSYHGMDHCGMPIFPWPVTHVKVFD